MSNRAVAHSESERQPSAVATWHRSSFEHIELNTTKPGDLGFGIDEDPFLLILRNQIQIHTYEHTFDH